MSLQFGGLFDGLISGQLKQLDKMVALTWFKTHFTGIIPKETFREAVS